MIRHLFCDGLGAVVCNGCNGCLDCGCVCANAYGNWVLEVFTPLPPAERHVLSYV